MQKAEEDNEEEDELKRAKEKDELEDRLDHASRLKGLNRPMSSQIGAATRYINKVRNHTNGPMPAHEWDSITM